MMIVLNGGITRDSDVLDWWRLSLMVLLPLAVMSQIDEDYP